MQNFTRHFTKFIPITATSQNTPFALDFTAAQIATPDLTFMFANPCTFDVWLEGTQAGQNFIVAQPFVNGWWIPARTITMGPFGSKRPDRISAFAYDNPCTPIPAGQVYTNRFVQIIYGTGG